MTFFQPRKGDALPDPLMPFMVFPTEDDCKKWMEKNLEDPEFWTVEQYKNTDIEDAVFLNGDGEFIYETVDGACSLNEYNTEKTLEIAQNDLMLTVRDAISKTGKTRIELPSTMLFEIEKDLGGKGYGLVFVTAIDAEAIHSFKESFPIRNVTNFDDINCIKTAVLEAIEQ